jgi:hypothetical protein
MRAWIAAIVTLVLATPLAIVLTFLLLPAWSWIEAHWGVEAVGHASLSGWCFVATWIAVAWPAAALAYFLFRPFRTSGDASPTA